MIWLEPWDAIDEIDWEATQGPDHGGGKRASYCAVWEEQLVREVGPVHALFGKAARLIGRNFDTDDALFELDGGKVAEVHLTWSRGQEPNPIWPRASIFETLEHWAIESMSPQHLIWAADQ